MKLGEILCFDPVPTTDVCSMVINVDRVVWVLHSQILPSLCMNHDLSPCTCPSEGARQCTFLQWCVRDDPSIYCPHIRYTTVSAGKRRGLTRSLALNAPALAVLVDRQKMRHTSCLIVLHTAQVEILQGTLHYSVVVL